VVAGLAAGATDAELPDLIALPLADLPTSLDSGTDLQLDVGVTCLAPEFLFENPRLQVSLRRHDKPEACAAAVEILAKELFEDGNHVETVTLDMDGLSGGTYEIVVEIDFDGRVIEQSEANNRTSSFVRIDDPRIEIHPIGVVVDPASPIGWGESALIRAAFENSGGLAAGALYVQFDILPVFCAEEDGTASQLILEDGVCATGRWTAGALGSGPAALAQAEADAITRMLEQQDALCDALWTRISSVVVAGLARNAIDDASAILVTPTLADDLAAAPIGGIDSLDFDGCELICLLRVSVTPSQEIDELDPWNNTMYSAIRIRPSGLHRPDLVPIAIAFDEDLPLNWNDSMVATATVTNRGGALAKDVEVYFDYRRAGDVEWIPVQLRTSLVGPVEEPETIDLLGIEEGTNTDSSNTRDVHVTIDPRSADTLLTPGTYELRVYVDKMLGIRERNEDNNQLISAFSVRGSELRPVSLEMPTDTIHQGDSLTVSALVENTGDRPVSSFNVSYYIDDVRFDTFYYASVSGQGLDEDERARTHGVLDTADLPAGEYLLRVVVDPDNEIPEFDEGDNVISTVLVVGPPEERLAELHPTQLEISPSSPVPLGVPISVTATVANTGSIHAGVFDVLITLWCDECVAGYRVAEQRISVDGLDRAAGTGTPIVQFDTLGLAQGSYRVVISVDPSPSVGTGILGAVEELDETNNALSVGVRVGPPAPDSDGMQPTGPGINLSCSLAASQFAVGEAGIPVVVDGAVVNSGQDGAGPFQLLFVIADLQGRPIESDASSVFGLGPGRTLPFSRNLSTSGLAAGVYTLVIEVDSENAVTETDESDNLCISALQVGSAPGSVGNVDLVPVAVRFDSPGAAIGEDNAVEPDQRLYVYVTVRNNGTIPSGSFNVAFGTLLGVETESWTSIGPLDQVEVSHPVPTDTPGTYDLSIHVDPDGLIPEVDDDNNDVPNAHIAVLPAYTVLARVIPEPRLIVPPSTSAGAAQWLQVDSSGRIYVAFASGRLLSIDSANANSGESVTEIVSLDAQVEDVAWTLGATPYAYVATSDGTGGAVHCVSLDARTVVAEASFGAQVEALARGGSGQLFAAIGGGFHQLSLAGSELLVSRFVEVAGDVLDILYDAERSTIYVLSTAGVFAFNDNLQRICALDAADLVGTPAVLALAGSGVYIGTNAGTGGIVYAASHCTVTTGSGGHILIGWRYPRMGTLPGSVASIVIDPRDIDPIYVATEAGKLYSLGFDGNPLWEFSTGQPINSTPFADKRTGRIFFGDDGGIPHVLALDGSPAFEIDLADYSGDKIQSTVVIVETRERTDLGTRFVRNYIYGTIDGAVYWIASQQ